MNGRSDLRIARKITPDITSIKATPDISSMRTITVNIHPPQRDHPADVCEIWGNMDEIIHQFHSASGFRDMRVNFLESEWAIWSVGGVARNSMGLADDDSDIKILIDLFDMLRNETRVDFQLPPSLNHDNKSILTRHIDKRAGPTTLEKYNLSREKLDTYIVSKKSRLQWAEAAIEEAKETIPYKKNKLWLSRKEVQHLTSDACDLDELCNDPGLMTSDRFPRDSDDEDDEEGDSGPNIFAHEDNNRAYKTQYDKAWDDAEARKPFKLIWLGEEYDESQ